MQDLDANVAKGKDFSVFGNMSIKTRIRIRSIDDRGTRFLSKRYMSTDKVGMKVCLENILDFNVIFLSFLRILGLTLSNNFI